MKSSPITDPSAWLLEASAGCLPGDAVDALLLASSGPAPRRVVVRLPGGLVAALPGHVAEWAWANLLHVFCLDDYRVAELVNEYGAPRRVLDAGAFIGLFSLRVLSLGAGSSLLLEPVEASRRLAEENLAMNGLHGRAVVAPEALAPRDGWAEICVADNLVNSSLAEPFTRMYGGRCVRRRRVRAVSLASLLSRHGGFDLAKLDIEGAEAPVLEAASRVGVLDPGLIPCLIVEAHGGSSAERVAALLRSAGYRVESWRLPGDEGPGQFIVRGCG